MHARKTRGCGYIMPMPVLEFAIPLNHSLPDFLLALGIKPAATVVYNDKFYPFLADQLRGVTPLGLDNNANLEAILEAQPTLIIGVQESDSKINSSLFSAAAMLVVTPDSISPCCFSTNSLVLPQAAQIFIFVFRWRYADMLFKQLAKIAVVRDTHLCGDLVYLHACLP
jgi:iron complex transport system substrate-binding protein